MIEILGYIFASILVLIAGFVLYVIACEVLTNMVLSSGKFEILKKDIRDCEETINELEARLEKLEPKDKKDERQLSFL